MSISTCRKAPSRKMAPVAGVTMVTLVGFLFYAKESTQQFGDDGRNLRCAGRCCRSVVSKKKFWRPKRAGIKEIILCKENKKDIDEIKPEYLKGLSFHYVEDIQEVIEWALLKEKVANPLNLEVQGEATK